MKSNLSEVIPLIVIIAIISSLFFHSSGKVVDLEAELEEAYSQECVLVFGSPDDEVVPADMAYLYDPDTSRIYFKSEEVKKDEPCWVEIIFQSKKDPTWVFMNGEWEVIFKSGEWGPTPNQ